MDDRQPRQRHLSWEGCHNTRDLGGLPTTDGRETRWRAVIRSDLLARLTASGRRAMLDYGVRTIIDLRVPEEAEKAPSVPVAEADPGEDLTYLNLPLDKRDPRVGALVGAATTRAEAYCILLDHYLDAVGEALRGVAHARPGGVIVHCHAGTDRTGMVSALLLKLAGVPDEAIAADYAESQTRLGPLYEQALEQVGIQDDSSIWAQPTVTVETMHTLLTHIHATYGGIEECLARSGLSPAEIRRLRSVLR